MIILGEILGVVLLAPFVVARRSSLFTRKLDGAERRHTYWLLGGAGFLNAVFAVLFYLVIEHIGAVLTTLIVATSPVFAIAGGVVFLKERVGARLALGAAVTITGVCLAVLQRVA